MISRIRMEAFGASAEEVANILESHADEITRLLGMDVSYGEQVISRALAEPKGSPFAWEGRMNLHPEIGRAGGTFTITGGNSHVTYASGTNG